MSKLDQMTYEERVVFFASAKRITTGVLQKIDGGELKSFWVGKLRGKIVQTKKGGFKFGTKEDAYHNARFFRESCRDDAKRLGLKYT